MKLYIVKFNMHMQYFDAKEAIGKMTWKELGFPISFPHKLPNRCSRSTGPSFNLQWICQCLSRLSLRQFTRQGRFTGLSLLSILTVCMWLSIWCRFSMAWLNKVSKTSDIRLLISSTSSFDFFVWPSNRYQVQLTPMPSSSFLSIPLFQWNCGYFFVWPGLELENSA